MKVSIITVVYNGIHEVENTILSVLGQDYPDIEYLIIDGGSTDGTVEVIKKYSARISYWVSEKDNGFYDALNKGVKVAQGEWIGILNSGDLFYNNHVISEMFQTRIPDNVQVIYGDSIEIREGEMYLHKASKKAQDKRTPPDYRHGASFIRADINKVFLYDVTQQSTYGYALDYLQINKMYKAGVGFLYKNVIVLQYDGEGMSTHRWKNKYLRALSENDGKVNIRLYYLVLMSFVKALWNKLRRNIRVYKEHDEE